MNYQYRNLPCTGLEWHVSGHDQSRGSSGVLEWCYDQKDAEELASRMGQFEQFTGLRVDFLAQS